MTLAFFKALVNTMPSPHRFRLAGVVYALEQAIDGGTSPELAVRRIGSSPIYRDALVQADQVENFQSIAPPLPRLDQLSVESFVIGQRHISLHCFGAGFTRDSVINFAGTEERTDFWSPSDVSTGIYSDLWTSPAVVDVFVTNPQGSTAVQKFAIKAAP